MRGSAGCLPAAREAFGVPQPYLGHGLDFAALEHDVRRAAHSERLREALRSGDYNAILTAASPDPYGAIATLTPMSNRRVAAVLAASSAANPLKSTDAISPAPRLTCQRTHVKRTRSIRSARGRR